MKNPKCSYTLFCRLAFIGLFSLPQAVLADLMIYPTRVVLEKNQRAAQIEIASRENHVETYRISLINRRMTETGEIVEAKDIQAGEQFAGELLRYSPRQVTLQPGAMQTIRLSVRKPSDLAAGEYRSHLQFDLVADAEGKADLGAATKPKQEQTGFTLRALIGVSIPVIVRHGETTVSATLDELAFEPAQGDARPALAFIIKRDGNRSVYGDLVAEFTPAGGKATEVLKMSGVAVYVPNALRRVHFSLNLPKGIILKNGVLTLRYSERADVGGKLIAQTQLKL